MSGYLQKMGLFAPELHERVGDKFDQLDELIEEMDRIIDGLDTEWISLWLDDGCRGFGTVDEFIESIDHLHKYIPDDEQDRLRTTIENIMEILSHN